VSLLLDRLPDFVDRIIALAQGYDLLMGAVFLRLLTWSRSRGSKEFRQVTLAKGVAQGWAGIVLTRSMAHSGYGPRDSSGSSSHAEISV
jgi:hypothetical protein